MDRTPFRSGPVAASPDDRIDTQKDERGTITGIANDLGDTIRIVIADDGAGIDCGALRARVTDRPGSGATPPNRRYPGPDRQYAAPRPSAFQECFYKLFIVYPTLGWLRVSPIVDHNHQAQPLTHISARTRRGNSGIRQRRQTIGDR